MADAKLMLVTERQLDRLLQLAARGQDHHADHAALFTAIRRQYEQGLSEYESNALLAPGAEEELGPFPEHVLADIRHAYGKMADIWTDADA